HSLVHLVPPSVALVPVHRIFAGHPGVLLYRRMTPPRYRERDRFATKFTTRKGPRIATPEGLCKSLSDFHLRIGAAGFEPTTSRPPVRRVQSCSLQKYEPFSRLRHSIVST